MCLWGGGRGVSVGWGKGCVCGGEGRGVLVGWGKGCVCEVGEGVLGDMFLQ